MAVPSKYIQSVVKAAKGRPKSTDWYREKIREFGTPKALDLIRDGKQASGGVKKFIIEVKPEYQCKQPNKTPKKRTRKWYQEVKTWGVNNAKWKSAKDWCANRGMEFKILTEKHLNPQYK